MPDRDDAPRDDPQTSELIDGALLDLWAIANRLARIRPADGRYRVTVFGSARIDPGHEDYAQVRLLAERLTRLGCDIVTGGGPGLMEAANKGARLADPDDRTESVGIRVALPFEQGANPFVERLYTHRSFFTRLHHFVRLSSAYVVMPGGLGTSLELMMVWQLLQVRHLPELPLILIGRMWRELVDWAARHMTAGDLPFANPADMEIPRCVDTVDEAVAIIEAHMRERQ